MPKAPNRATGKTTPMPAMPTPMPMGSGEPTPCPKGPPTPPPGKKK